MPALAGKSRSRLLLFGAMSRLFSCWGNMQKSNQRTLFPTCHNLIENNCLTYVNFFDGIGPANKARSARLQALEHGLRICPVAEFGIRMEDLLDVPMGFGVIAHLFEGLGNVKSDFGILRRLQQRFLQ